VLRGSILLLVTYENAKEKEKELKPRREKTDKILRISWKKSPDLQKPVKESPDEKGNDGREKGTGKEMSRGFRTTRL